MATSGGSGHVAGTTALPLRADLRAATSAFMAWRSALPRTADAARRGLPRPVMTHSGSRGSPIRGTLYRRLQPFRRLHDCSGCFRLERWPGGICTHWKSAALSRRTPIADVARDNFKRSRDASLIIRCLDTTYSSDIPRMSSMGIVLICSCECHPRNCENFPRWNLPSSAQWYIPPLE